MMQSQDIVNGYLGSLYSGDFAAAKTFLAADFTFSGPFVQTTGCDAFLTSAEGLKRIATGHTLLRQVANGDTVCSLYDVHFTTPSGAHTIPMSEWHSIQDGKIVSGTILFDARRFTAMMEPATSS